jgi:transposase
MIKFQSLPRQKRQAIRDEVLRLYAETDMSYGEIAEVNEVQIRTVAYIIRNFASELPYTPVMRKKKKDVSPEDYDALRAEITRLKKELRYEKLRSEALDTMIDVAEEMFNIPVRKKAGTKQ